MYALIAEHVAHATATRPGVMATRHVPSFMARVTTAAPSIATVFREMFTNDADLETARRAYCRLSSEPFGQLQEPLDVKRFHTLEIPRSH